MSPALLAVAGFDGYLRRFNPAFERFGYSRDELLARPWVEFAHPDDRERMMQAAVALEGGADVVELENRVVCRDGSVRWVQWSTRVVPGEGLFYAAGRDMTESRRAAQEQAALRRVATLVAHEPEPDAVFAAVAREIGEVLSVDATHLGRFDPDGTVVSVAQWGSYAGVPIGARYPLEGDSVSARVLHSGRPARMEGYAGAAGPIAETVRGIGIRHSIGVPIAVHGRSWGVMIVSTRSSEPFPAEIEPRLEHFTELIATAIANAEARAEVRRLADEQAALRRVATLVAQGASARAVFDAVTTTVSEVLDAEAVSLARYDDDALLVLAQRATRTIVRVGERVPMEPTDLTAIVQRTGGTARRDHSPTGDTPIAGILRRGGVASTVVVPVVVDGRIWGVMGASWERASPPPADAEERMARFAELLGTAIANADSQDQLVASRARVLAAADDARRRVVRDLHDGAQQRLVNSIVTLKLAQEALGEHRPDAETLVTEALRYAEGAIDDLRELSHGILPAALMRGGLRAAVGALVSRLELSIDVDIATGELPRDVEASAYFIIAEALTNVVKHARATRAEVTASDDAGGLRVQVRDDGVGGADADGLGLIGIADRVAALGGELSVEDGDTAGTVLTARLPLST